MLRILLLLSLSLSAFADMDRLCLGEGNEAPCYRLDRGATDLNADDLTITFKATTPFEDIITPVEASCSVVFPSLESFHTSINKLFQLQENLSTVVCRDGGARGYHSSGYGSLHLVRMTSPSSEVLVNGEKL